MLGAVSVVLVLVSILAVGTARLLLDTQKFSAAVDRSLQEPVVSDALADYLSGQVTTALARSGAVDRIVPADLDRLVPVLEAALEAVVERQSRALVGSDRGRELIVEAVGFAHRAAVRVVRDQTAEGGLVVVLDDRVSLNLVPAAVAILGRVQASALVAGIELPEIDRSMTPAEQIEVLNDALATDLPADFAQLTVYEPPASDDQSLLAQARRALRLFEAVVWLVVAVTVALGALALVVSPNRRRTMLTLTAGAAVSAVIAHLVVQRMMAAVPALVEDPEGRAAAAEVVRRSLQGLDSAAATLAAVLAAAAVMLLVADVVGGRRALDAARRLARRSPDVVRAAGGLLGVLVLLRFGLDLLPFVAAVALASGGFVVAARSAPGSNVVP